MKNFVTLFPGTRNVHLTKDVGMIPYIMFKYYGYKSKIVCYNNDEYNYLTSLLNGLDMDFIKKVTGNNVIDSAIYMIKNAKKIDILNLYHMRRESLILISIYKFLNRTGKVYLKLDLDIISKAYTDLIKKTIKTKILIRTLKKCKLISVETTGAYKKLIDLDLKINVEYIPNGAYNYSNVEFSDKENIICTVGRIGSYDKSNETLLEAYQRAYSSIKDWKLYLVGTIDSNFNSYIKEYFNKYPYLKDSIIFFGEIIDRDELSAIYKKSKICCLTSRHESFGLVLVEAMSEGCFIITSDIGSARDITKSNVLGKIFDVGDINALSNILIEYCNNDYYIKDAFPKIIKYYNDRFDWVKICGKINQLLNGQEGKI